MRVELEKARNLRSRLESGHSCVGAQASLIDPTVMEIFGAAGFDWIAIDTEHGAHSPVSVRAMLQAAAHTDAVAIVRVLRLDGREIGRMLDIGAGGILCPFINTEDDARALVAATRYPPEGTRSYGPRRAGGFGLEQADHMTIVREALICMAMIESTAAVTNIEQIIAVDGITGVVIGPLDLSIDLGVSADFGAVPYVEAIAKVREACRAHGTPMGIGCASLEQAKEVVQPGDQLLLVGGDDLAIASEARRTVAALGGPPTAVRALGEAQSPR
jgi:2-keto-3-deoxy-L-rhamnonate aldolase RhmA